MTPLTSWTCDSCSKPITGASMGLVISRAHAPGSESDFRIVHKDIEGHACDLDSHEMSIEIDYYLGVDGLTRLLSNLSHGIVHAGGSAPGVGSIDAYVDLVRRLQVPYYEEARSRLQRPDFKSRLDAQGQLDQVHPYQQDTLLDIAAGKYDSD